MSCEISSEGYEKIKKMLSSESGQSKIAEWIGNKIKKDVFVDVKMKGFDLILMVEIFGQMIEYPLNPYECDKLLSTVLADETRKYHRGTGSETERM